MITQFMVAVLGSSSSACKSTAAHGQQLYGSLYQNCSTCLASLHAHRVHHMAAMSSQAPMNKMMEKLMDKPAHHRWLACQCIMLDKNIVVKTSSSFGHLPQPPQPPPPPPPQCKKRPRPPPEGPAPPKVAKTQHGEAVDEMVDVEVEESPEDKEAEPCQMLTSTLLLHVDKLAYPISKPHASTLKQIWKTLNHVCLLAMVTHEWKHWMCAQFQPRMELLRGRYWRIGLLNGHSFWKGESSGQMNSPKVVAFLWFSQHQQAWFFSNMAMDENMVEENMYWEEFGKLTIYATCTAEHKGTEMFPGHVVAPHDSNLRVPYKAWCYLQWLEQTNMSWAEDYAILDKKMKELEAQEPKPGLHEEAGQLHDEVGGPDHGLQDGGLGTSRVPHQQAPRLLKTLHWLNTHHMCHQFLVQ